MKKLFAALSLLVLSSCAPAYADDISPNAFQFDQTALSPTTLIMEGAFDALLVIDSHQTNSIRSACPVHETCAFQETNPWLGSTDPDAVRVRNYFIASALIHGLITYLLPQDYRIFWQGASFGLEINAVRMNAYAGLGLKF
jgi:hypothetical protein